MFGGNTKPFGLIKRIVITHINRESRRCLRSTTSIINDARWTTDKTLHQCFKPGKHLFISKGGCGVGYTTRFLKTPPTFTNQCSIIIVPNRQVILDKQKQILEGRLISKNRIGFIYGESENGIYFSDKVDFNNYDILMMVADSFIHNLESLKANETRIDKILIDEAHSVIIQSSFRRNLIGFNRLLESQFPCAAIASVTATPLSFQFVDILIKHPQNKARTISVSENQKNCFLKAKKLIDAGENVIIASNNARLISRFAVNNVLSANLKTGKNLKRSLVELVEINNDVDSKLTILSSSGFEGFDITNGINNVFIFEDRASEYETFFTSQIIQIIGRSRAGTASIFWCRNTHSKGRAKIELKELFNKLLSRNISTEKKLSSEKYKRLVNFTNPSTAKVVKAGDFVLEFDNIKWKLYNETRLSDVQGIKFNAGLFQEHNFNFRNVNDGASRFNNTRVSDGKKERNIIINRDFIRDFKVFDGLYLKAAEFDQTKLYERYLTEFLRRKYWAVGFNDIHFTENEKTAIDLFRNPLKIDALANDAFNCYRAYKKEKEKKRSKIYTEKVNHYRKNIKPIISRLILMLASDKIFVSKKDKVWRDYNLITTTSLKIVEFVSAFFYRKLTEFDIRNCNSRILYAICGLALPNNFYGVNKENKTNINIALNNLKNLDTRHRTKTPPKIQKSISKKKLLNLGFHPKVAKYVIDNFFESNADALFNFCAYHEKKIISNFTNNLKEYITNDININVDANRSFIRRHDSIIVFEEMKVNNAFLNNFEYLNQSGWFAA